MGHDGAIFEMKPLVDFFQYSQLQFTLKLSWKNG